MNGRPPRSTLSPYPTLSRSVPPLLPRVFPAAAVGFAMLGLAGKLLGRDARPGDLQTVLRGLPNNVTTEIDRKSTRLNSSHANISYAVFCLKKKMSRVQTHSC